MKAILIHPNLFERIQARTRIPTISLESFYDSAQAEGIRRYLVCTDLHGWVTTTEEHLISTYTWDEDANPSQGFVKLTPI